jgi:hypothetical protein
MSNVFSIIRSTSAGKKGALLSDLLELLSGIRSGSYVDITIGMVTTLQLMTKVEGIIYFPTKL